MPLFCLAVAYADSGLLFILQGIYHETISALIPVAVFSVHSLVGIMWIYKAGYNSEPSQTKVEPVSSARELRKTEQLNPPSGSWARLPMLRQVG